jgi:hydroxyethylthiazole kinase-like uncharacterized protein yjeF
MVDEEAANALVPALLPRLGAAAVVVLDALALDAAGAAQTVVRSCASQVVLTPHDGEMARLLQTDLQRVQANRLDLAREAARAFDATLAVKGAETLVVTPSGDAFAYREGNIGLATSGSGDTLAGIVAGLAARGADAAQAAVWAVYVHGSAGNRLTRRMGSLGFLARELLDQVPPIMARLERPGTKVDRGANRPGR